MAYEPSPLQVERGSYEPRVPDILREAIAGVAIEEGRKTRSLADEQRIAESFPHSFGQPMLRVVAGEGRTEARPYTVGVVLSGGQASGGHNVIVGLHDGLQAIDPGSRLIGFVGGPRGILDNRTRELTAEVLRPYRNTGGFDLIGSGRDKIETAGQLAASRDTCRELGLDGLLVIGGDDSNTNAAVLAEFLRRQNIDVSVVGAPKTIDGDLRGGPVELPFGFDTATKVYSGLVGDICRDAASAGKYWHFVKLMGRSASHVTLECALQTRVNVALIGEEVRERGMTLEQIVDQISGIVRRRSEAGRNYGVCLVPEGLIEFIPEMRRLIDALNAVLSGQGGPQDATDSIEDRQRWVRSELTDADGRVFDALPEEFRRQLLLDRDAHGNVQVSKIDTERLISGMVAQRVEAWRAAGEFEGKFLVQAHFFGYEGRCAAPSNFDADYSYGLGRLAALLIAARKTGYMCAIANLARPVDEWQPRGVPLTSMMHMEMRKGKPTPVIGKALVTTDGDPFRAFFMERERWAIDDAYRQPGAIQYFGPAAVASALTRTLELEGPAVRRR